MNFHRLRRFAIIFVSLLLSRGLAAQDAGPVANKEPRIGTLRAGKILFLGNSITLHGPAPAIGWTGNFGMAATSAGKDYVHLVAAEIAKAVGRKPEVNVRNIADFERQHDTFDVAANFKNERAFAADIVIVAIGENVPGLTTDTAKEKYAAAFTRLLTELKSHGNPALFVRGSFWPDAVKDAIMKKACVDTGGVFVDLGGMGKDEANLARSERKIEHAGVGSHPGDKGMKAIADAIGSAIQKRSTAGAIPAAPTYTDHADLMHVKDDAGVSVPIKTPVDWERRRKHILAAMERVMGPLPNPAPREALAPIVMEETKLEGGLVRKKISYQTDAAGRVVAYLFIPGGEKVKRPAVLCLQQTTKRGAVEPAGLAGNESMHVALHLARRGFITIAPDYPGFGESKFDFSPRHGYASGSMKAVWDNIRTIDYLETLPKVDASRIGVIGHSLGGHNAMFTAAFEPRLKAIVSNCGFTSFRKDDVPSWTGPSYMPRIKTEFASDAAKIPFDFTEVAATFAPRPFLALAAEGDTDFDIAGIREVINAATPIYTLLGAKDAIQLNTYPGPHAFPAKARETAYEWLERKLR